MEDKQPRLGKGLTLIAGLLFLLMYVLPLAFS
jgi:hypothetical protein